MIRSFRGAATTVILAAAAVLVAAPSASASSRVMATGPECAPNVVSAVLQAINDAGLSVPPGRYQYLQVSYDSAQGRYVLQPCVVTVPAAVS